MLSKVCRGKSFSGMTYAQKLSDTGGNTTSYKEVVNPSSHPWGCRPAFTRLGRSRWVTSDWLTTELAS